MPEIAYPKLWVPYEILKAKDLNDQFGAVAAVVNGNITDINVNAAAAIRGFKLASWPNGIANLQLNDKCVTKRNLADDFTVGGTNIENNSITTDHIVNGTIKLEDLAVGASVAGIVGQKRQDTVIHPTVNDEKLYLEYTWTTRSGFYFVLAGLHVVFGFDGVAPAAGYAMNVKLDGTAGSAADGTILGSQWFQDATTAAPGIVAAPATLTLGVVGYALSAGEHRIKVSGYPFARFVAFAHINSGWSILVELA